MTEKRDLVPGMTTTQEKLVLEHLASAWNEYVKLPVQHPSETEEFLHAIHLAQGILACRVARTADPGTWPTRIDVADLATTRR